MLSHTPYAADASATKAGATVATSVFSALIGLLTDTRVAIAFGVLGTTVGIFWACVAGYQKWQEHRLRMAILRHKVRLSELGQDVTIEDADG